MKTKMKRAATLLLMILLCSACRNEWKDFTFCYTAECIGHYKLVVTLRSDSTFRIEKYNYYMDNFERKQRPVLNEGRLSASEFEVYRRQLKACHLFALADTYGYEKRQAGLSASTDILYQVYFQTGGKEKFILYKNPAELPLPLRRLLKEINTFLADR